MHWTEIGVKPAYCFKTCGNQRFHSQEICAWDQFCTLPRTKNLYGIVLYLIFPCHFTLVMCDIKYHIASVKFWRGKFWHFWCFPARPSKFNSSKCLKTIQPLQVYGNHLLKHFPSNIWRVSIRKISPHQNFVLYGILHIAYHNYCTPNLSQYDNYHDM